MRRSPAFFFLVALILSAWIFGLSGCSSFDSSTKDSSDLLQLVFRGRHEVSPGTYQVVHQEVEWRPAETAVIVVDMWDQHWCKEATRRVEEMAPRLNRVLAKLRERGVLVIHAPSATMEFYEKTPQRKRALSAPPVEAPVELGKWCYLNTEKEAKLPIDDSDGGCDCEPRCVEHYPWKRQIGSIEMAEEDAVSDSGIEIYNLLEQRGIQNVFVAGVHANMCVLGRPFGIRQMVYLGKKVALIRDLTDTMYNSRMPPYVSHFQGTDLVIEHIEKYWCPTLTSDQIVDEPPFRFSEATSLVISAA